MFDLQKSCQVVCFVLHQSYETSVELLVPFYLILELALLMTIELFFIHRERQALNQILKVIL